MCVWCVCLFVREHWKKKKEVVRCEAWNPWVTPLSAGPWSPGPPGEWWHWFSPTPPSAAPEERRPPSPGPSSPRMGGSGSSLCPPTPSYSGSAACPGGKRTEGEKACFMRKPWNMWCSSEAVLWVLLVNLLYLTLPFTTYLRDFLHFLKE